MIAVVITLSISNTTISLLLQLYR